MTQVKISYYEIRLLSTCIMSGTVECGADPVFWQGLKEGGNNGK